MLFFIIRQYFINIIEEGVRPMLQSEVLNNVLTEEDRKLITTYLDLLKRIEKK